MSELVRWDLLANGVAIVTVNNPPVNAIEPGRAGGDTKSPAFKRAKSKSAVRTVILIGAGRTLSPAWTSIC